MSLRKFILASFCLYSALSTALAQNKPTESDSDRWKNSCRPDYPRAVVFFTKLQEAFKRDDRAAVASMANYPTHTLLSGKRTSIRNPAQLLTHYDEIFDADVSCVLRKAQPKNVWANCDQGFSIGLGKIWFDGIIPVNDHPDPSAADFWTKYPIKLKTVNNGPVPASARCAVDEP